MNLRREEVLSGLTGGAAARWDVLVIGGGATGLGCAVDAAARGLKVLLLEAHDFAKGTSSRSTKLVHGGVRYLKQGNIALVLEALHERGRLCRNANHLVRHLAFVVPNYHWWEGPFYGIGMKVYDQLAGRLGLEPSRWLGREETLRLLPNLEPEGLMGGVVYYDGQFDDARLAVNLMQTIFDLGGTALNYCPVVELTKRGDLVTGARARCAETGAEFAVEARAVINATGVFCDAVRRMDEPGAAGMVEPSQGVHLVVPKEFLPGNSAVMIPHTDDGRVLFAVPWHDRVILGTTDTPVPDAVLEPRALEEEIGFIFANADRYLAKQPERSDVLSVYAGLRPLVRAQKSEGGGTAALSRDHVIVVSRSGLLTITGGKWTTYRRMAQDAVDQAMQLAGIEHRPCATETMEVHGAYEDAPVIDGERGWEVYGSDAPAVTELGAEEPELKEKLHPELPFIGAEVVWAARREMARTVEDVLARRTRALLLGAKASVACAPKVAAILARELG
ncbi:MAG: glycerol-3-phosphate dehydrogenase/oxidase, partial [Opitutales bacterium]